MSSQLESIYSDELILLAETLGEVKTRTEKLEGEFSTHAKPLEAATNALSAALSGIKALQFHVLDNNLGALSARVEEMRKAVDEQVGVIALELKKADETNAAKAGADAEALRSEIVALQSQLGSLVTQFGQQLERVEFAAKEEAKKLQLIPGPAGAAGASLNPRGTFIDGEVYNRLDVVSWLGSSYIATVDGVTEKPSKNSNQWQTLASRGGGGAGGVGDFGSLAGVAQINQGGTGQTTRVAALNALLPDQAGSTQYMLLTDGSGTVSWGAQPVAGLPSQTSNSGRLLTTNGSTASWSNAVTVSGSNATVGGTLTVSGAMATNSIVVNGFSGISLETAGSASLRFSDSSVNKWWIYKLPADANLYFRDALNARMQMIMTPGATASTATTDIQSNTLVSSTTASTTTSSGALVVGNGTQGGLGVGGSIYAGGSLALVGTASSIATNSADSMLRVGTGLSVLEQCVTLGLSRRANYGDALISRNLQGQSGTDAYIASSTSVGGYGGFEIQYGGVARILVGSGATTANAVVTPTVAASFTTTTAAVSTVLQVINSTASTGTSSGALVVSGGVGVAKSLNVGEAVTVAGGSFAAASFYKSASLGTVLSGATGSSYDLYITNPAGNHVMQVPTGTRNAEFAATLTTVGAITSGASISTSAPTGGSGAWELGVYSATAPSATGYVTIEIGGIAYKLLASNV